MDFHPIADCWPLISGIEFDELVSSVRAHGVLNPITLHDGLILDGRNRYLAAQEAGVDCPTVDYAGSDPVAFAKAQNDARRHLSESQKSMVGARLENLAHGRPKEKDAHVHLFGDVVVEAPAPVSRAQAAEIMGVSERSIASAAAVIAKGAPELVEKVEAGAVSVRAAADVATLPQPEQAEIVAMGEREILEAAKRIRAERAAVSRETRLDKIAKISRGNAELNLDAKYPVILADPPWRYENPPIGASNRSIENHYPTMTLDEICALPVAEIAADDAILYLWATAPKLAECFRVIEAWGFEYRTNIVWVKDRIGMGYHARNQHELLLICKRGSLPPPAAGTQPSSVIEAPRAAHSAKPDVFAEMIEGFYPQLPKIELFCRSPRDGWAVWGNQSQAEAA